MRNNKVFKSQLSMEQIKKNFENTDFFTELHQGLTEVKSIQTGAKQPTMVHRRNLPSVNVVGIRKKLNMTQSSFASILGVSARTVESWESGRTTPTPTAKKLLHLIETDPSTIDRLR